MKQRRGGGGGGGDGEGSGSAALVRLGGWRAGGTYLRGLHLLVLVLVHLGEEVR